jgi:hypothetical protein
LLLEEIFRTLGQNLNGNAWVEWAGDFKPYCYKNTKNFRPFYEKRKAEYLNDANVPFKPDVNWPVDWFKYATDVNVKINGGNVLITWKTSEKSDSNVFYASNVDSENNLFYPAGYFWSPCRSDTPLNPATGSSTKLTNHSVTLSGLEPNTYEFRIRSSNLEPNEQEIIWSYVGTFVVDPLTGTGTLAPAISVTPASRDFGSVQVGSNADQTFTVQNTGGRTLTGSAIVPAPFSIVSGSSYSLTAGQSQVVTVRFSPTAAQSYSQNVTFTGDGGATRPVRGSGYNPPTQPPTPPTGVLASEGIHADRVRISWNAPTGPIAISYEIWRNTKKESSSASKIAEVTSLSYDDASVAARTTYWYWVKAKNSVGTSGLVSARVKRRHHLHNHHFLLSVYWHPTVRMGIESG